MAAILAIADASPKGIHRFADGRQTPTSALSGVTAPHCHAEKAHKHATASMATAEDWACKKAVTERALIIDMDDEGV